MEFLEKHFKAECSNKNGWQLVTSKSGKLPKVLIINYCCPLKVFDRYNLGLDSSLGIQPLKLPLSLQNIIPVTMNKGTHFYGQQ